MRGRLIAIMTALVMIGSLGVSTLLTAPVAGATSQICHTFSKHYAIRDGSVPINVASTDIHIETCSDGGIITMANGSSSEDDTAPGNAAGFVVTVGQPYRTSFVAGGYSGGGFGYNTKGSLKTCASHWTHILCSITEKWTMHTHVSMLNAIYHTAYAGYHNFGGGKFSLHHRIFTIKWTWACTSKVCGVKLH